eukprot:6611-Heterococcus_DN1.PRE.1
MSVLLFAPLERASAVATSRGSSPTRLVVVTAHQRLSCDVILAVHFRRVVAVGVHSATASVHPPVSCSSSDSSSSSDALARVVYVLISSCDVFATVVAVRNSSECFEWWLRLLLAVCTCAVCADTCADCDDAAVFVQS